MDGIKQHIPPGRTDMCDTIVLPLLLRIIRNFSFPHKLGVMDRLFGTRLAKCKPGWVECSNGVNWKLDLSNSTHRWIVYGDYEGSVQMDWIRQWLREDDIVVDSGANIGQMLLYVAPLPGVKVYAFEPNLGEASWLRECLARQLDWQVELTECGLAERKKSLDLQCDGPRSTTRLDWYKGKGLRHVRIEVDRLDTLLSQRDVRHVRLWKLDVEGAEHEALLGADRLLSTAAIGAILLELCPSNTDKVTQFLGEKGYFLYQLGKDGSLRPVTRALDHTANLIALSPSERA